MNPTVSTNENRLGIVIRNSSKNYIYDCIESVYASKLSHLHNIETEIIILYGKDSVEIIQNIRNKYSDDCKSKSNSISLTFVEADMNEGRAHTLNTGIRLATEHGCGYICCLSDHVVLEENALLLMLEHLKSHPETGLAGCKSRHMHMKEHIHQYGIHIDFKNFKAVTLYADACDDGTLPNIVYCDAIGSCVMAAADTIQQVGLIPEENYMYWDEISWGYRFRQSGYKVAALGDAVLYHQYNPMSINNDTSVNYYMTRNCLDFFMKYTEPKRCAKMSIILLRKVFESFYLHRMAQAQNMAQSDISALLDAIGGINGRAAADRILENDEIGLGFVSFFEECEAVYTEDDDPFLEQVIRQVNPTIKFLPAPKKDAVTIVRCESILHIRDFHYSLDFDGSIAYIDKGYRLCATKEDARMIKEFEASMQCFLYAMQPPLLRRICEMRGLDEL